MIVGLIFSQIVNIMDYKKEEPISNPISGIKSILISLFQQVFLTFWLITVVYSAYFSIIFSFASVAQIFFVQKYNLSINMANLANSLSFGSAVVLTPIAGIIITKTG